MSNKFTEKAEKVLNNAIPLAQSLGHTYIGSEHILLSLCKEKMSLASVFLQKQSVDAKKVEDAIKIYAGSGGKSRLTPTDMTPRCKKILEYSYRNAQKYASAKIGTEHILLAILEERECVARKLLEHLGADVAQIKDEVLTLMRSTERNASVSLSCTGESTLPLLTQYGKELTGVQFQSRAEPVIGREEETDRLIRILCRKSKNNPCLLGEAGVGKTAIVEGLAHRIAIGNVPKPLLGKRIFSVDLTSMVAGTKYRGDFEERIKNIVREVSNNPEVILFIDEIHTIVGAGAAEGAIDAANILKPELSRGEIQVIGATTLTEYRKTIEKDPALERRFQPMSIREPSDAATLRILEGVKERYEVFHDVYITPAALRACISLSKRYLQDRYLPDKALDLLDEACAKKRVSCPCSNSNILKLTEKIRQTKNDKEAAIKKQDFSLALNLKDLEAIYTEQYKQAIQKNTDTNAREIIDEEQIKEIVTEITGIPAGSLGERNDPHLEETLNRFVLGQETAVHSLSKAILRHKAGLSDPLRPVGVFLFLGESGVGKTELAKALSLSLFSSEKAIIRYDMSEFIEKHAISKLIGAPPGYVGYEEGGTLTEKIRRHPYSVVLFDEIEKAHPDVLNILLQITDDGILTDSMGRTVSFRHSVIILTSNIGADKFKNKGGLGFLGENDRPDLTEKLNEYFRPEFINRLDEIILFSPLTEKTLTDIAKNQAEALCARTKSVGYPLTITETALAHLASKSLRAGMGARPLSRLFVEEIENPISRAIVEDALPIGTEILIDYDEQTEALRFHYTARENFDKKQVSDNEILPATQNQ